MIRKLCVLLLLLLLFLGFGFYNIKITSGVYKASLIYGQPGYRYLAVEFRLCTPRICWYKLDDGHQCFHIKRDHWEARTPWWRLP